VASYDYDPWGVRRKLSGGGEEAVGYTGHWTHESGLVMAPYRVYDPVLGRWLSEDPIEEAGGVNLYGYVGNGPVGSWDPLGLEFDYSGNPAIRDKIDALRKASPSFDNSVKALESCKKKYTAEPTLPGYSHGSVADGKIYFPVGDALSTFNVAHNTWHGVQDAYPEAAERSKINPFVDPSDNDMGRLEPVEREAQRAGNLARCEEMENDSNPENDVSARAMRNGSGVQKTYGKKGSYPILVPNPMGFGK